jgi:hypothetical protein
MPYIDVPPSVARRVPRGRYAARVDLDDVTVFFIIRSRRRLRSGKVRLYTEHLTAMDGRA